MNRYKQMPTYVKMPIMDDVRAAFKFVLIGFFAGAIFTTAAGCGPNMDKLAEKTGKAKAAQLEVCRSNQLHAPARAPKDKP